MKFRSIVIAMLFLFSASVTYADVLPIPRPAKPFTESVKTDAGFGFYSYNAQDEKEPYFLLVVPGPCTIRASLTADDPAVKKHQVTFCITDYQALQILFQPSMKMVKDGKTVSFTFQATVQLHRFATSADAVAPLARKSGAPKFKFIDKDGEVFTFKDSVSLRKDGSTVRIVGENPRGIGLTRTMKSLWLDEGVWPDVHKDEIVEFNIDTQGH